MVNEIPHEQGVFDPRNGCLIAAFTAVPALFFTVAGAVLSIGCTGIGEGVPDTTCGHHLWLVAVLFPGAPAAIGLGAALTVVRRDWRWFGAGIVLALACLSPPFFH